MVAIKTSEAERFLARDLANFSAFLVFGTDVGLVSERVRRIVRAVVDDPNDPFQLVRLSGDELGRDAPRLADEAQTVPLFGGRRAVLVDVGGKNINAAIELYLSAHSPCPVILEAGALKPDAPLRKAIERSRHAAAIECYPDGAREIGQLIDAEAAAAGVEIDPDAKSLLASLLGADRLASRSEIAKLMLYTHGRKTVMAEDVEAVVADASAQAFDNAIDAAFSGDTSGLDAAIERLHLTPVDAGLLLGAAIRHATMLHRTKLSGSGESGSIPFRGGLSARRKAARDRQLATLNVDALGRMIARLGEAAALVRREPRLAENHAVRALWTVALAARPRRERG